MTQHLLNLLTCYLSCYRQIQGIVYVLLMQFLAQDLPASEKLLETGCTQGKMSILRCNIFSESLWDFVRKIFWKKARSGFPIGHVMLIHRRIMLILQSLCCFELTINPAGYKSYSGKYPGLCCCSLTTWF